MLKCDDTNAYERRRREGSQLQKLDVAAKMFHWEANIKRLL